MREELRVNVFKCLLINHTTWTFLWGEKGGFRINNMMQEAELCSFSNLAQIN